MTSDISGKPDYFFPGHLDYTIEELRDLFESSSTSKFLISESEESFLDLDDDPRVDVKGLSYLVQNGVDPNKVCTYHASRRPHKSLPKVSVTIQNVKSGIKLGVLFLKEIDLTK